MAPKKPLASKEQNLFKELLNLYETRQLKKGVKTADQILKKNPDNGETLCMKGLLLTHMGRREEGLELVKKGILLDLTSHIVWHVYGLIQKGQKDYEGALKSYSQALRYEKENINLLNDASNLQTQVRQFEGLKETRETLLRLRPNVRQNWLRLAVAYHLCGDLAGAKNVMEEYMKIVKNVPDYDYEHSELTLYQIDILEELGEYQEAISLLDTSAKDRVVIDRKAIMELRARLLTKTESPEAEQSWRALIDSNSDCYDYYRQLFVMKGLSIDSASDDKRGETLALLDEFASLHPKAAAPRRIALVISQGEDFRERARAYLLLAFEKGIPSIFTDVKSLYKQPTKGKLLEEVVLDLKSSHPPVHANGVNGSANADASGPEKTVNAESAPNLWIIYYLAQHYSHLSQFEQSLALIDEAISSCPSSVPELFTCKARCLKRAGDMVGAARCMEDARLLDRADRFLNTKSAKYHLRAGMSAEAQAILGLFTKKDAPSPGFDLEEMQSLLYLTEEADCQKRLGRMGPALKKYMSLIRVLEDFKNDQYDFHYYSIRRATIRTYIQMLKWADYLPERDSFVHAAIQASKIYVLAHDDPSIATPSKSAQSDAEKKAQKKAKKAAAKTQESEKKGAADKGKSSTSANEDQGLDTPNTKDEDPDGTKALQAKDGLDQAWKLLKPLANDNDLKRLDVCLAVYDVAVRQSKYLQAARALLSASALDPDNSELHVRIVDFKRRITTISTPLSEKISPVVNSALSRLYPSEDLALETFTSQFVQRHSPPSARASLASARVLSLLNIPIDEVESQVFSTLDPSSDLDVKCASAALEFLNGLKRVGEDGKELKGSARIDEFRRQCNERFGLATIFRDAEELERMRNYLRDDEKKREEERVAKASEEAKA